MFTRITSNGGSDTKIVNVNDNSHIILSEEQGVVKDKPFDIPLSADQVFNGEAYIHKLPVPLGDVPNSIFVAAPRIWSFIFGANYDSEKIGKSCVSLSGAFTKLGLQSGHIRNSRKSLIAKCKANGEAVPASLHLSGEHEYSFSIVGLLMCLVMLSCGLGHWKASEDQRLRAVSLGKAFIDCVIFGHLAWTSSGVTVMIEDGKLDCGFLFESQKDSIARQRLSGNVCLFISIVQFVFLLACSYVFMCVCMELGFV